MLIAHLHSGNLWDFFSGKILIFSRASYTPLLKTAAQQTKSASGNQEGGKIS